MALTPMSSFIKNKLGKKLNKYEEEIFFSRNLHYSIQTADSPRTKDRYNINYMVSLEGQTNGLQSNICFLYNTS